MNELDNVLFEMGLTLEDVIEPDLNKQKEYHKLLEAILNSEGEKQAELLDYAFYIIQMDKKAAETFWKFFCIGLNKIRNYAISSNKL